jgi:hypothetical protein
MRSRQTANEASAIGSLKAINSAEVSYAAACGAGGFAQELADLAVAPPGGVPFVGPELASGTHSGYTFVVAAGASAADVLPAAATCNGSANPSVSSFYAIGVPRTVGSTGHRSFATDSRGTLYQDLAGATIANPIPAGTQVLQ